MLNIQGGFQYLGVRIGNSANAVVNHIYIKRHLSPEESNSPALFVTGLPACDAENAVKKLFSIFGDIGSVLLHPSKLSAIVTFKNQESLKRVQDIAVQASIIDLKVTSDNKPQGVKEWMVLHKNKVPGNSILQQELDEWMRKYEEGEKALKAAAAEANADDGWTVVTRKSGRQTSGVNGVASGGVSKVVAEAKFNRKPAKVLQNFYKHQKWEKQQTDLQTLRTKFEDDKKRVAAMKAARRFKPD